MGKRSKNSLSRMGIGARLVVQLGCVIFLLIAANYVGFEYYERWDFSRSQKFALADQTKQVLRNLQEPVKIAVYFSDSSVSLESSLYRDVQNLLREYQFSGRERVEVEMVNPAKDASRAQELQAKYEFGGDQNVVILDYAGRVQVVPVAEMGEWDLSGVAMGEPARLLTFAGESALTGALLSLLNPELKVVYALEGHGEVSGAELNYFGEYLRRQNAVLRPVNLAGSGSVPEDAGMVLVAGPTYDLTALEVEALRRYWAGDGRLLVALEPGAETPRLAEFLAEVGITPQANRVLTLVPSPMRPGVYGIFRDVPGIFLEGSVVTKRLGGVNGMLPTATQTLALDERVATLAEVQLRPLIGAPEQYWGETKFDDVSDGVEYEDGVDAGQPLVLAVAAERGGTEDDRVEVAAAKMVVVGNRDFLRDASVRETPANLDFLLSAANWMFERSKLTGIAPKSVRNFSLSLTAAQLDRIGFYVMVVIPGVVAVFGLIVAWRRRA